MAEKEENDATRITKVRLDNAEGLQREAERLTERAAGIGGTLEEQADGLAKNLKALISEHEMPDLGASLAGDLLAYAFEEIDFYSIARSYLADFHDFRSRKK